jgi:hypothetical protein
MPTIPGKAAKWPLLLLPLPSFLFNVAAMNSRSVGCWLKPQNDGGQGGYLLAGSAVLAYMNVFVAIIRR